MAWTYNPAIPTDRDEVRLLIGDTDTNDQLLQDEEITFLLSRAGDVTQAAIEAARTLQSKFARRADTTVESVSVKYSQLSNQFGKIVKNLEAKASKAAANNIIVTGISEDAISAAREDADRYRERFYMGKFDNPPESEDEYWYKR